MNKRKRNMEVNVRKYPQPNYPPRKRRRKRMRINFSNRFLSDSLLKHTLEYVKPDECFLNLRLVSCRWKQCIEQMRFDEAPNVKVFGLPIGETQFKPHVAKYIRLFSKLQLCLHPEITRNLLAVHDQISGNMEKLKEVLISLPVQRKRSRGAYDQFVLSIFEKNKNTLERVQAPSFCFHDLALVNLKFMKFSVVEPDLQVFSPLLEKALKIMKKIQIIEIELTNSIEPVSPLQEEDLDPRLALVVEHESAEGPTLRINVIPNQKKKNISKKGTNSLNNVEKD